MCVIVQCTHTRRRRRTDTPESKLVENSVGGSGKVIPGSRSWSQARNLALAVAVHFEVDYQCDCRDEHEDDAVHDHLILEESPSH